MHFLIWLSQCRRQSQSWPTPIISSLLFLSLAWPLVVGTHHMDYTPRSNPHKLECRANNNPPLIITNNCPETIYPGILSQSGIGPGTGGFELSAGTGKTFSVSENWQGRVWGRTNCSFNSYGTGSASGRGPACSTGDCGALSCIGTGEIPTTLVEFTLDAGDGHTYYDISLVDGYNLPMAVVLHSNSNSSFNQLPANLTNPSCVGTVGNLQPPNYNPYQNGNGQFLGTSSSNPLPFENTVTLSKVAQWCPWDLQVSSSTGPSGGVYIYPDGNVDRPQFDPCYSACAKYNKPQDCCTGSYDSPSACSPSGYSKAAKAVCPDAYSYAFDDQTSTFIIPSGAGFEVVFCPGARSTNIIGTSKAQLTQLGQQGHLKRHSLEHDGVGIQEYYEWSQTYGPHSQGGVEMAVSLRKSNEGSLPAIDSLCSLLVATFMAVFLRGIVW